MSGFASIQDQQRPIGILAGFLRADKLPHAMVFSGPEGVGKRAAAEALAMACNCTGPATTSAGDSMPSGCGRCRPCRKILAGSHPDILSIEASGQFIRIGQIRDLMGVLAMKPYEARLRVVIVPDAQRMNPEAGNALLKVLEEPPERTILILTAPGTAELLPTITSRCQQIRFNPLTLESLAGKLSETLDLSPGNARILAAVAGGSQGRALRLHRQNWLEKRQYLVGTLGCLDVAEGAEHPPVTVLMSLALALGGNRDSLTEAIDLLMTLYRDLAVGRYRRTGLMNEDLSERILAAAGKMEEGAILSRIEALETAGRRLRANANPRLTAEALFLQLGGYGG